MARQIPRHPPLDSFGNSLWDQGDEVEGYHRNWDGVLWSSYDWQRYYQPRGRMSIPPDKWPLARLLRTQYRQGVVTCATVASHLGIHVSTAHRFVTGQRYWWL